MYYRKKYYNAAINDNIQCVVVSLIKNMLALMIVAYSFEIQPLSQDTSQCIPVYIHLAAYRILCISEVQKVLIASFFKDTFISRNT